MARRKKNQDFSVQTAEPLNVALPLQEVTKNPVAIEPETSTELPDVVVLLTSGGFALGSGLLARALVPDGYLSVKEGKYKLIPVQEAADSKEKSLVFSFCSIESVGFIHSCLDKKLKVILINTSSSNLRKDIPVWGHDFLTDYGVVVDRVVALEDILRGDADLLAGTGLSLTTEAIELLANGGPALLSTIGNLP